MLRNDLVTFLSEHDNDTVAVDINGILVDVESVSFVGDRGSIVLTLDREDLHGTLEQVTSRGLGPIDLAGPADSSATP